MSLAGRTIGVTADRRGEEQALMFRRLGAEVVLGPTMATLQRTDDTLTAVTDALVAAPPDVVVANTGLGIRTWMESAAAGGRLEALTGALARAAIVCRGPKADGAVKRAGLAVAWRAPGESLAEVGDHLLAMGVSGARVAVQLHGDDRSTLTGRLGAAGAEVVEVPVYRWAQPADVAPARALIDACCAGRLDAVTFTAGPQVRNLFELADLDGRSGQLADSLNGHVLAACIGPVCAAVAVEEGIVAPLVPPHWRLGALVKAVESALGAA